LIRHRDKISAYSGSLSKNEIIRIKRIIPVVSIGIEFGKEVEDCFILSLDAIELLKIRFLLVLLGLMGGKRGSGLMERS